MGQFRRLVRIGLKILLVLISPVFAALFVILFFGPPSDVLYTTVDLLRMTGSATGTVSSVTIVRGNKGTSRPVITYWFEAEGRTVESRRMFPGWAGNHLSWSGGGAEARKYVIGSHVPVIYVPGNPQRSAIERGWFKSAVGFALAIWGMVLTAVFHKWRLLRAAAAGAGFYGFAVLFVGPVAVRISELHFHLLAWLALAALSFWWNVRKQREGASEAVENITPSQVQSSGKPR